MPKYRVTHPDGRKLELTGDSPPTDKELEAIFAASGPPAPPAAPPEKPGIIQSFVDRGIETIKGAGSLALDAAKSATSLEGQATFLPRLAKGVYEGAVESGAGAIARQFPRGVDNLPESELLTGAMRGGAAAVPFVGPYVMNKVSDIEEGNWRKAAGETLFDVAAAGAGKTAPKTVPPALAKMKSMGGELALDARDIARSRIWGPAAGATIGTAIAGPVGGAIGLGADLIYSTRYARNKKLNKAMAAATDAADARIAEVAKKEAALQKLRDKAAMDQLKLDRDITKAEMAREAAAEKAREAATKAQEAASIAGAKTELKPLEAAEAAAGKQIAAAERTAAKGEAQGQKIDLKQISRAVRANKAAAADRLRQETAREAASIAGAKAELKPLELSQKAQPKNPVLTLVEGKQAGEEVTPSKAPAAPPAPEPQMIKLPPAEKSLLEKMVELSNTLGGKGYSKPAIADRLMHTFKKSNPDRAMAERVAATAPEASVVGAESEVIGLADQGWTVPELAKKLMEESRGLTNNEALDLAVPAVSSVVKKTPEQAAGLAYLKGKNLKKVRWEDIPGRRPPVRPLEPSPKPKP